MTARVRPLGVVVAVAAAAVAVWAKSGGMNDLVAKEKTQWAPSRLLRQWNSGTRQTPSSSSSGIDTKSTSSHTSQTAHGRDSAAVTQQPQQLQQHQQGSCDGHGKASSSDVVEQKAGESEGQAKRELMLHRGGSLSTVRSASVLLIRTIRDRIAQALLKVVNATASLLALLGVGGRGGGGRGKDGEGGGARPAELSTTGGAASTSTVMRTVDWSKLSPEQVKLAEDTLAAAVTIPGLKERAEAVNMRLDRTCVFRYLNAAQWKPVQFGKPIYQNIADSVMWREDQHIMTLGGAEIWRQARRGYLYINGRDKAGRPVIMFRPAHQDNSRPAEAIKYLIYTLERAIDMTDRHGLGAYSIVVDCSGFSLNNMPPVALIKKVFSMLHHHYPTRVGFIAFLYTGSAFQIMWKMLSPLVSPTTRVKIRFLSTGRETEQLAELIPVDQLEERYGGTNHFEWDPVQYFGYNPDA